MENIEKISSYDNMCYNVNGRWVEPPISKLVNNNNRLVDIISELQEEIVGLNHINASFISIIDQMQQKQDKMEIDIRMLCENQNCIKHETYNISEINITNEDYKKFLEMMRESMSIAEQKAYFGIKS